MRVVEGQNIFDVCLQEFGDLELLFEEVIIPNKLTVNSDLNADLELSLNTFGKGNQELKDYVQLNGLILNNRSIPGEFDLDVQLAIQWPIYVDLEEVINLKKIIQVV